jgi:hypothetical protein
MSSQTFLGVSAGTIIGIGGAVSPIGDIPSLLILGSSGVNNPAACLQWMKNQTEIAFFHPCSPVANPANLVLMSNGLVFIAILLIVWAGIEFLGKNAKNKAQ